MQQNKLSEIRTLGNYMYMFLFFLFLLFIALTQIYNFFIFVVGIILLVVIWQTFSGLRRLKKKVEDFVDGK